MRRKWTFSKLLLLLESAVVLYTTYEGFALARLAVGYGYLGTLPWVAAMVSAAWGAYGASAGFYYNKAKAENTTGGIVFESACGRQARSGQDCDGWRRTDEGAGAQAAIKSFYGQEHRDDHADDHVLRAGVLRVALAGLYDDLHGGDRVLFRHAE